MGPGALSHFLPTHDSKHTLCHTGDDEADAKARGEFSVTGEIFATPRPVVFSKKRKSLLASPCRLHDSWPSQTCPFASSSSCEEGPGRQCGNAFHAQVESAAAGVGRQDIRKGEGQLVLDQIDEHLPGENKGAGGECDLVYGVD